MSLLIFWKMGCTGSKTAQASKPEDKVASATLLTEPSADNKETKPDVPAAEVSTTETASKEAVVDAPAEQAKVTESDSPADANSAEADQKVENRDGEAEATKEPAQGAAEEGDAQEQLVDAATTQAKDQKVEAPEETPVVTEGEEKLAQEDDATAPVSVVAAPTAPGSQKGGCLNFCLATEAQTEIVVEN
jgi:hypothetical protein